MINPQKGFVYEGKWNLFYYNALAYFALRSCLQ